VSLATIDLTSPRGRPTRRGGVRAYAFQPGEPPKEIQLWKAGDNPTDYGVHEWSERSAQSVIAWYNARGNPLQIDVEHNGAAPADPSEPGPTGGYARLELRNGEPWLVFDWSAYAVDQIRTRQRLFLSPEYDVDRETGEIVRLVRVSLVADPGTHHARMLASASRTLAKGDTSMNLMLILAALKAALANEDPEAAKAGIASLIAEIEKMAGAGDAGDAPAPPPPAEEPAAAAAPPDGDAPAAEEDKDKMFASTPKKPATPATVKTGATAATPAADETPETIRRLAKAEADLAELKAAEDERKLGERLEPLPESLHAHARTLTAAQFASFVALPEVDAAIKAKAKVAGVRATSKITTGAAEGAGPGGTIPAEDARHMARIFGNENRPSESVEVLPDGRVRATHLFRPAPAAQNGK
jgi:hypothetical protein